MPDDRIPDDRIPHDDPAGRSDDLDSSGQQVASRAAFRARALLAAGVACCLGLTVLAQTRPRVADPAPPAPAAAADASGRVEPEVASRARARASASPARSATDEDPDTVTARPEPTRPAPVAGLTRAQMDNAEAIVRAGREMGVPRRALVIAVATAMQESTLYNVASGVLPESQRHPHQGVGWDHDSVGLFQQRSSSGWGPVGRLMDPEFATRQFLTALLRVPGWQRMRLTDAAQAVQVSAYPGHYARHEGLATEVVDALLPSVG
ncbi:hypothetical protein GA0070616_4640 [Micromonospora nigra]|uniref:Peptidase M23 n=2 Tax=Micromonospora nigra TaxID=145857 RepID=A0A1C6SUA9_9ACTN|nr:peptidase M23 [Micromonospora nigra]SCL33121.1 hypothetical protein GA0070616_4640 [Micromonospora nigra]